MQLYYIKLIILENFLKGAITEALETNILTKVLLVDVRMTTYK